MFHTSDEIRVGILFSLTGTTGITERGQYQSALLAIKQINEQGGINGRPLLPIVEDIASDPYIAAKKAEKLILSDKVVAIIGTYTSACRKMIIPVLEKYDSLLLYPTQYEGEEQHPNIFYCGPLPNQQLLNFIPWLIENLGKSFYLIGSDYIYSRETNKHIRHLVQSNHGIIVGEKYTQLGNQKFRSFLREISELDPDIIFSTMVGENAIAFYQQYHQYGIDKPIASGITAETEIAAINKEYAIGHYSCFPYFNSIRNQTNQVFLNEYRKTYGTDIVSSAMENAYNSVFLLSEAMRKSNTIDPSSIRINLPGLVFEAPQGHIQVDKSNQHLWLNSRIGQINAKGQFDILWESENPIAPVPFFTSNNIDTDVKTSFLAKEEIENKLSKYESLIEEIKKATHFLPYTFAIFDQNGILLNTFKNDKSEDSNLISYLKVGTTDWTISPLKQSGIGLALSGHLISVVSGKEHQEIELQDLTTIGIPIKGETGTLQGVLGVFIEHTTHKEDLETLVQFLSQIVRSCMRIIENSNNYVFAYNLLNGMSKFIPENLFVLKDSKIIYNNASAQQLLKDKYDFVQNIIKHVCANTPSETKTLLKRENSGELFEVRVTPINQSLYVFVREVSGNHKTSSLYTKDSSKIITKDIIGSNERFLRSVSLIKSASKTNANVLILGESGTGKELFARAIHNESARNDKPFVALNCAAIPRDLINAELFGYVEGAFTGAKKGGNPGKFEIANGGTLFLDEIGDMPLDLQATLLRVLQEKEVVRVGGHKPIPVDIRIIAATHKKINQEIAYKGSFRSDLYFRLNVFSIELIPLRERIDDIPELTQHFLKELSIETGMASKTITDESIMFLQQYNWPGNIRELRNVIERAFYLSEQSTEITIDHLPKNIIDFSHQDIVEEDLGSIDNFKEIKKLNDNQERNIIMETLFEYKGNITKTAKHLGVSRTTLYRKINEYKLKK